MAVVSALIAVAVVAIAAGCANLAKVGTQIGADQGIITDQQAESINRTAEAVEKSFQDITPEQEYYIGRAVAATILDSHPADQDKDANLYLNRLGQTLAMASDRPETFGGYHFLLLDSDEINAFAAPGGLILVSRGLVRCCRSEDALAAVLAHEIGHVQGKHGLQAIKKSRLTSALAILAVEGTRNLGGEKLVELTEQFEGSIMDITQTLVNSGYARKLEKEADQTATTILERVGYNPNALVEMLGEMKQRLEPGGLDFAKTHPDPQDRINDILGAVTGWQQVSEPEVRHQRFVAAMGSGTGSGE